MTTTQNACPFGPGSDIPQVASLLPPGYDFTDPDVLLRGIPVTEFAELRKTAPVRWNEQAANIFDDGGYWVISRHDDIKAISRNGEVWSTNRKGAVMRLPDGVTSEQLDLTKALLINHDAPEHTRLRKIVSRLFTPRSVASLEEKLASPRATSSEPPPRRTAATSSTTSPCGCRCWPSRISSACPRPTARNCSTGPTAS